MITAHVTRWFKRNRKAAHDLPAEINVCRCYLTPDRSGPPHSYELLLYRSDGYWMQIEMSPADFLALTDTMTQKLRGEGT